MVNITEETHPGQRTTNIIKTRAPCVQLKIQAATR